MLNKIHGISAHRIFKLNSNSNIQIDIKYEYSNCQRPSIGTKADGVNSAVKLVQRQRRTTTHVYHHCIAVCIHT